MIKEKVKKTKKERREQTILMGLVDLFIESGKPIGSNTLKEHGFQNLSSATIRNYFAQLESEGYLHQPHPSGGRIPTSDAFRLYAQAAAISPQLKPEVEENLQMLGKMESRNLMKYLQTSADLLSATTGYATFLSSVRFDHDLILEVKLVGIDQERILCVIVTDFGQVLTEVIAVNHKVTSFALKRIEGHIQWRLRGGEKPENLTDEEERLGQRLYSEIMVRYLVRYSNFSDEETYRTGFSRLLSYPEFSDPVALATGLSLFENSSHMRLLLNDCSRQGKLSFWIGSDLAQYATTAKGCAVIAIPYYIGSMSVGAVGILGPCRMPYKTLFATLEYFSNNVSKSLTKSLLKFKLTFRQPRSGAPYVLLEPGRIDQKLLEIKE